MSDISDKKISKLQSLVVDSGPLIKGANIRPLANKIYTIPEVISEIRDKHSRDFLNQILYDIEIKIVNFSKKSGDFPSLSAVDLRVLALTYMLEVEANGKERLRKEPLKSFARKGGQTGQVKNNENSVDNGNNVKKSDNDDLHENDKIQNDIVSNMENLTLSKKNANDYNDSKDDGKSCNNEIPETLITNDDNNNIEVSSNNNDLDINETGIITSQENTLESLNNVLLQMRLNLVTVEGIKINKVKNWVLRCHACFNCGNATLIRTSTSTDENEPKGGRHANNLILREDQKEYQKALKLQRKQKRIDIFDPDYIPELFIKSNSPSSLKYSGPPVIGYGRRNPNEARRKRK
ncbi:3769_t:CDS:2 [Diversispora eburnea]|uniref:3769_t:CDS:1 n=1 Tax=Diversispora eburnea TaxID=1213867 RepID=A0A9N9BK92_9GLOM|nr:3769_t:CDS:2 [Diversispora eburnea]